MRIGTNELLLVLLVVLVIFGPKQLPKLGKMFGKTIKGLKEGMNDIDEEEEPKAKKTEAKAEDEE